MCVKDVKYIDSVKKRLVWVFYNGRDWGDDNETGLKEGGGTEMSIYSASIHSNDNYNLV